MDILSGRFKTSIVIFLLLVILLFCSVVLDVYAQEIDSAEIVILFDVSASMNTADPSPDWPLNVIGPRVSTEAARLFAFLRPSFTDTYISLVIFNSSIETVLESANVRTEGGIINFELAVESITNNKVKTELSYFQEHYDGYFRAWHYATDIGSALKEAHRILDASNAPLKSVVLFTDGRIDLGTPLPTQEVPNPLPVPIYPSIEMAAEYRDKFASDGIRVYSIGLNYKVGSVDEDFLCDLSDTTGGLYVITPAGRTMTNDPTLGVTLVDFFRFIYADLFETVAPPSVDLPTIPPDGVIEYEINIYGQSIKEVNITLFSAFPAEVRSITTQGINFIKDTNRAIVDTSAMITNIKLIEPLDGDWIIEIAGTPGSVVWASEISLYDISLKTTLPDDNIDMDFGETLNFDAFLYNNNRDIVINTHQIYEDSISHTYMELYDDRGVLVGVSAGILNLSSESFNFEWTFDRPGTYEIKVFLANNRLSAVSDIFTVTVKNPTLLLESDRKQFWNGEDIMLSISLKDSYGNMIDMPEHLRGMQGRVNVLLGDIEVDKISFDANQINSNEPIKLEYRLSQYGEYTFIAILHSNNDVIESESLSIRVEQDIIIPADPPFSSSISHTIRGSDNSISYDLSKYFKSASGAVWKFKIEDMNEDDIDISTNGNEFTLTFHDSARGNLELCIVVFNENGAEYRHILNIAVSSIADVIIVVIIAVGALVVLATVAILFLRLKTRINMPFKLTLSVLENGVRKPDGEDISTNIKPLKPMIKYKNKTSVNLWDVLKNPALVSSAVPDTFEPFCSGITLVGVPFKEKREFKVKCKDQKTQVFNGRNRVLFTSPALLDSNITYNVTFTRRGE